MKFDLAELMKKALEENKSIFKKGNEEVEHDDLYVLFGYAYAASPDPLLYYTDKDYLASIAEVFKYPEEGYHDFEIYKMKRVDKEYRLKDLCSDELYQENMTYILNGDMATVKIYDDLVTFKVNNIGQLEKNHSLDSSFVEHFLGGGYTAHLPEKEIEQLIEMGKITLEQIEEMED